MKKIKLLSWNVNGIRAIAKKGFKDWLKKENPHILCLQETKAWQEQLDDSLTKFNRYYSYFSEAEKKGYSGVALYTKEEPIQVKTGFGINIFDSEGRTIIAEYPNFLLFNIYFPNGKRNLERLEYKLTFYDSFLKYVQKLKKKGKKIIICGDVNTAHKAIDLTRPKENEKTSGFLPIEREWIDRLIGVGFIDTYRLFVKEGGNYTWWDMITRARERNVGWRIDYFFTSGNMKQNITNAYILSDVMGSDHCPVGLELKF
ncbi:exodeoxyribonuclease III [Bacteroidota bacterium]